MGNHTTAAYDVFGVDHVGRAITRLPPMTCLVSTTLEMGAHTTAADDVFGEE